MGTIILYCHSNIFEHKGFAVQSSRIRSFAKIEKINLAKIPHYTVYYFIIFTKIICYLYESYVHSLLTLVILI